MMNKNLIAFSAASVALASGAFAQDEISVTTTFAWESAYVFRGAQLAEETFMPAVDFAYGGAYFGIWSAQPAGGDDANEVDFYGGYGWDVADGISLDVGLTYYSYPDSSDGAFDGDVNTTEAYIGAAFDTTASPSIYVYNDFDLDTITVEGSVGHTIPVDDKLSIDLSAALGYVTPDGGDSFTYLLASAGIGYAFNDYVSGSLFANFSTASEDMIYDDFDAMGMRTFRADKFWFGFSITGGF